MKKLIILFCLMALPAIGQTNHMFLWQLFDQAKVDTNAVVDFQAGTIRVKAPVADQDAVPKIYVDARAGSYAECSGDDISQVFTAAGGFEIFTNCTGTLNAGGVFIPTSSNVLVLADCDYKITTTASMGYSAATTEVDGHTFTNGVEVGRIGWSRSFRNANDQGSMGGIGLITIASNTVVDFRIDVTKNGTLTTDHFSLMIERIGP